MLRLVIEVEGETERRLMVTSARRNIAPEQLAAKAIADLYWIIDHLTEQERARIFAGVMKNPASMLQH